MFSKLNLPVPWREALSEVLARCLILQLALGMAYF